MVEPVTVSVVVIVGVVVVIGVFVGIAATRVYCRIVRNAYTAGTGPAQYGAPTFAAWLAAQNWWVRWVC